MMGAGQIGLRHDGHQVCLNKIGGLARRQSQAVRHAENMGVDRNRRFDPQLVEHNAGRLTANPWKRLECRTVERNLTPVLVDHHPRGRDHVFGLGAEESD